MLVFLLPISTPRRRIVDIHFESDARRRLTTKTPIMVTIGLHPLYSPVSAALAQHYSYYTSRVVGVKENTPEFT
jgi:hypothetical protein